MERNDESLSTRDLASPNEPVASADDRAPSRSDTGATTQPIAQGSAPEEAPVQAVDQTQAPEAQAAAAPAPGAVAATDRAESDGGRSPLDAQGTRAPADAYGSPAPADTDLRSAASDTDIGSAPADTDLGSAAADAYGSPAAADADMTSAPSEIGRAPAPADAQGTATQPATDSPPGAQPATESPPGTQAATGSTPAATPSAASTPSADAQVTSNEPLLAADSSAAFQRSWEEVQTRFVDDPQGAVEDADRLVANVMQQLAEGFAQEREGLEAQWGRGEDISTEDLRVAMQRYRSFFQRLLST